MLDIGAGVEQGINQRYVVTAGCPMERRFAVPHPDRRGVEIGAGSGQQPHDRIWICVVAGPVGKQVQWRAPAALRISHHAPGEARLAREQLAQPVDVAPLQRRRQLYGEQLVTLQHAWFCGHRREGSTGTAEPRLCLRQ